MDEGKNNEATDLQDDELEFNDKEIQEKFNLLLTKYQNLNKIVSSNGMVKFSRTNTFQVEELENDLLRDSEDKVPVLTETVTIQSSPARSILDATLDETGIDMDNKDREILARALEKQLNNNQSS